MIGYAELRPGRGLQPFRAALYYAHRLAVRHQVRNTVAGAIAFAIRLRHGDGVLLKGAASRRAADALQADGIAHLPDTLVSPERAARMLDYFAAQDVVAGGKLVPKKDIAADEPMASYPLPTILANKDVRQVIMSPLVLDIAARYLGCQPTLSSLGVRWSFPTTKTARDTQRFHRDPDDWRFLKFFLYLTDVTPSSGPHVFVKCSHRTAGQLRSRPYEVDHLRAQYGAEKLDEITGPRGTAFIADTYGIHAGMVPTGAPRLILQAQYSLLPVFAFRYEPVEVEEWADCPDPYVSRLLAVRSRTQ